MTYYLVRTRNMLAAETIMFFNYVEGSIMTPSYFFYL
jgi:hypothetical protein